MYLDDLTAGGKAQTLARDFDLIQEQASRLGLSLNIKKCEIISASGFDELPSQFSGFRKIDAVDSELLTLSMGCCAVRSRRSLM